MKPSCIHVVVNETKTGADEALHFVTAWGRKNGIRILRYAETVEAGGSDAVVLALGGDGTVLRAASQFLDAGLPILGVNLGSLGFLTQIAADDLAMALDALASGAFMIEERMRLAFRTGHVAESVLNDLVFTGASASRFCELQLSWRDGVVSSFPGDGLILSTATGSTAYSLSAGGPVIVPPAACILATPLAVHKLGLRPVIFPPEEVLDVQVATEIQLIADGDDAGCVEPGTTIRIERSSQVTRLIRIVNSRPFFHVLDEKLNWGDHRRRLQPDERS